MKLPRFRGLSLRSASKKLLGLAAVSGIFLAGMMSASADGPAFNNLPNDYPTLQVAKQGGAWQTSTNAQVGETVNLLVWVHNTHPNTVAENTVAKVTIPTTVASTHTPTATVSADNATAVNGAVQIAVGTNSTISYVPGSAKLMKNVNGVMQVVNWAPGTDPDTVVTTGVHLGNISGCWDFAQAVFLQVKVGGANPAINTNKRVELAGGTNPFDVSTNAHPGDAVNFRIFLQNTGNGTGINPTITDTLDSRLSYLPNSSYMIIKQNNQDTHVDIPDSQIHFNGQTITWSFNNMAPQPDAALYLIFQTRVADASHFPVGTTQLQNCATSAFVGVTANTNCVTINVIREADQTVSFSLRKEVTNLTLGNSLWYQGNDLASAKPDDSIAYRLTIVNTGNTTAQNVTIKDILPTGISFDGDVTLFDSAHPNGMSIAGNAIVQSGYVLASLQAGTQHTAVITFRAKVTTQSCTPQTLVNTGQVLYQSQVKAQDVAKVLVSCTRGLIIQKDLLDPNDNQFKDDIGQVHEGQILTYRITVQNNGTVWANHPIVRDVLPSEVTYITNSLAVDGEFMTSDIQTAFFNQGMVLANLNPGHGKTITFQVKVNPCPQYGDTEILNYAYVKADSIAEISDTARAFVHVDVPHL